MVSEFELKEELPTTREFIELRAAVGWGTVSEDTARRTLTGALYTVCLRKGGALHGLGRVVGDGVLYFYVSDVIVSPAAAGGGFGLRILDSLKTYVQSVASPGATVALLSVPGREPFYEKAGFVRCPNEIVGSGLCLLDYLVPAPEGADSPRRP
jgi:hypothetical protein